MGAFLALFVPFARSQGGRMSFCVAMRGRGGLVALAAGRWSVIRSRRSASSARTSGAARTSMDAATAASVSDRLIVPSDGLRHRTMVGTRGFAPHPPLV